MHITGSTISTVDIELNSKSIIAFSIEFNLCYFFFIFQFIYCFVELVSYYTFAIFHLDFCDVDVDALYYNQMHCTITVTIFLDVYG